VRKPSKKNLDQLSKRLNVETPFINACLEASIIEVYETKGRMDLGNGTALRLRRLQRICLTFEVDLHAAILIYGSVR